MQTESEQSLWAEDIENSYITILLAHLLFYKHFLDTYLPPTVNVEQYESLMAPNHKNLVAYTNLHIFMARNKNCATYYRTNKVL